MPTIRSALLLVGLAAVLLASAGGMGLPAPRPVGQNALTGDGKKLGDAYQNLRNWILDDPKTAYHLSAEGSFPPALNTLKAFDLRVSPQSAHGTFIDEERGTSEMTATIAEKEKYDAVRSPGMLVYIGLGVTIYFAAPAAHKAASEKFAGAVCDRYDFDTSHLLGPELHAWQQQTKDAPHLKASVNSVAGTAWVDQASNRLVGLTADVQATDQESGKKVTYHQAFRMEPE